MENSPLTSQLDRLFSIWNNAVDYMNFWVCGVGMYRATATLVRVYTTFFNYHYFTKMTNMPDETVLPRIVTALDLEIEKALHYHNENYDSDSDYHLPGPFLRPVCIYHRGFMGLYCKCCLSPLLQLQFLTFEGYCPLPFVQLY